MKITKTKLNPQFPGDLPRWEVTFENMYGRTQEQFYKDKSKYYTDLFSKGYQTQNEIIAFLNQHIEKVLLKDYLVKEFGADNVFDTDQVRELFTVHSFLAPCVSVTRKRDNKRGTLEFCHSPRYYWGFQENK